MYLNDLLDALDNGKAIELPRHEILDLFQKQKSFTDKQRLELFHRLGYRDQDGKRLTQEEVAHLAGVTRALVAQYDTDRL